MDQNQPFTIYKRDLSNPIFSLNFSSVGTELFLTGKDQKCVRGIISWQEEVLCIHEGFYFQAFCQPIDCKVF